MAVEGRTAGVADVIRRSCVDIGYMMSIQMAEALDAAGLLVQPIHVEALAACEKYAEKYSASILMGREGAAVLSVGRASLAAKKAKEPKWIAYGPTISDTWFVGRDSSAPFPHFAGITEPQARAVAAALNALES